MKPFWIVSALLLTLAGCASALTVSHLAPGANPEKTTTPTPGTYSLYRRGADKCLEIRELNRKSAVGFERMDDGRLLAWCGDEVVPIDEGEYRWIREPLTCRQVLRLAGQRTGDGLGAVAQLFPFGLLQAPLAFPLFLPFVVLSDFLR